MLSITKAYISCAFMKWAGFDSLEGRPFLITIPDKKAKKEEKDKFLFDVIGKFVEEYVMTEFDVEKSWRQKEEKHREDAPIDDRAAETPTAGRK